VLDVLGRHRARGLQPPINGELLARIGVSESLIPRTLQALTLLDLINDDGAPTAAFESLRLAPEADYQARMAEWLSGAYADVLTIIDPATATDTQVRDAFRPYKPHGQQDRMVTLFNGLYAAAGVRAEMREAKPRVEGPRPVRMPVRKIQTHPFRAAAATAAKPKSGKPVVTDGDFAGLPPMLAALLKDLPAVGEGWTQEQRDKVVKVFPTILDFAYPVITPNPPIHEGEEVDPFA
jgi:hypothetical protein